MPSPRYTICPAAHGVDAAMIKRDGKTLLLTCISADRAENHNRLAETVARILERHDAEIEAAVSALEERWAGEARS